VDVEYWNSGGWSRTTVVLTAKCASVWFITSGETEQRFVAPEFRGHHRLLTDNVLDSGCFLNELLC